MQLVPKESPQEDDSKFSRPSLSCAVLESTNILSGRSFRTLVAAIAEVRV